MATHGRIGNNLGFVSSLTDIDYTLSPVVHYNFRKDNVRLTLADDRWYPSRPFAIGKGDDLSIVLDNDVSSKRFDVSMFRRVSLSGNASYTNAGTTISDFDGPMFGPTSANQFPFEDFALVMQPRVRTNVGTTSEILWRWKSFGANNVGIEYDYPIAPSQTTGWSVDYTTSANARASVLLPSGAARNLNTLTISTRIAVSNDIEVSAVTGHFFWLHTGYDVTTATSDGTDTTVTLASPTAAPTTVLVNAGLTNGDTIYLTSVIGWLPSGQYVVHTVTGMTFKITVNTGGAQGPTAGGASFITLDTAPGADWTNVTLGDVVSLATTFGVTPIAAGVPLIVDVIATGARSIRTAAKYGNAAAVNPVMSGPIADLANVKAFPAGDTITLILYGLTIDPNIPFTGTNIGVGGSVLVPTWYTTSNNTTSYPFADGINYIKTTTITPNLGGFDYSVTFKNLISTALSGYTQWQYEDAYLCPMTAANVCSYLNNLAVCGLSANGRAETSSRGAKVQIATSTIGSVGSVQIRGGLANSALANVRGAATETGDFLACNTVVPTTQTSGFHGGWPVKITNTVPYVKVNELTQHDLVSIVGNEWTVGWFLSYPVWSPFPTYNPPDIVTFGYVAYICTQFGTTGVFQNPITAPSRWSVTAPGNASVATSHAEANVYWQIERQGNLMAMVWHGNGGGLPTITGYGPGDYLVVSNDGITDTVSQANIGTFIITAMDEAETTFYFENPNGVEERAIASINEITRDSLMPGDKIVVGSDVWGVLNRRTFTVDSVGYVSDDLAPTFTTVETPAPVSSLIFGPKPTVQVQSGRLHSFIKTINSIVPLTEDPTYSVISFVKDANDTTMDAIGENYGSQLSALCKLAFPVVTSIGTDGYAHSVGLVGEADKVMYGYETDPVSYPGVVAAGSNINISGPLVKRIQVGLSLRVRGTVSTVFEAVRGAVATFVNNSKVGESIAISDIISVASSIGGVEAVSVASPAYTTTADRITVQPYEKPLVLQPELDITLTLIG